LLSDYTRKHSHAHIHGPSTKLFRNSALAMDPRSKTSSLAATADQDGVRARHPTTSSIPLFSSKTSTSGREDKSVTSRSTPAFSQSSLQQTLLYAALSALASAFGVLTLGFFSLRAVAANYGSEKPSAGFWARV